MCGISGYIGTDGGFATSFAKNSIDFLWHRGPDSNGTARFDKALLTHTRLRILEIGPLGAQPMYSRCGRYCIVFNGEIYNHLELRKRYLPDFSFKGHSDTETIIELFSLMGEHMLKEMVGMWAILIWDNPNEKMFVSRDRYGQKPLYFRSIDGTGWVFASEMKPLMCAEASRVTANQTAAVEYLALGNYSHLGQHTFFNEIKHFPQGHYGWVKPNELSFSAVEYWSLPRISTNNSIPFNADTRHQLKSLIVDSVLSQTLSDVPIGITLSGGIDSSIIAGVLAMHYDAPIQVFSAQAKGEIRDESHYFQAVLNKWKGRGFEVHLNEMRHISIEGVLETYLGIQEEPFGDTSIVAHGSLMEAAANANIKVILGGQGGDEVFFGYNNMALAILPQQLRKGKFSDYRKNISELKLGSKYTLRSLLQAVAPGIEHSMRVKSRHSRRAVLADSLLAGVDESLIRTYVYDSLDNVWQEAIYGSHLPHLEHYDDRNGMAFSVEGRMPFLDHRIAEFVAKIDPLQHLIGGMRKFMMREACREYLPEEVYQRTDKIGFHTPLAASIKKESQWVASVLEEISFLKPAYKADLINTLQASSIPVQKAIEIWRCISYQMWMRRFIL